MEGRKNMKTLANCDNIEFFQQTYKIVDAVKAYLNETNIMEIRKRIPDTSSLKTEEEKKEAIRKGAAENLMEMIRTALAEHTAETLKVLGLICFCEDEEKLRTDRTILSESVAALCDPNVLDFFISLMQSVVKISRVM